MKTKSLHIENFENSLNKRIFEYFEENNLSKYANSEMKLKFLIYLILIFLFYYLELIAKSEKQFILFYLLCGLATILGTINIAHDAAHHVLFKSRKINNIIYFLLFQSTGYNPDIWKENHVVGHHNHPNIKDLDPHFPETPLMRFAEWQTCHWYHKYQQYYVPFLYCIHSVVYLFVDEPMVFFGIHHQVKLTPKQLILGILGKILYLFLFILVPIIYLNISVKMMIVLFLINHIIISIIMTLIIGINHLTNDTLIITNELASSFSRSELQIRSTVDFATENKLLIWIIGGFNIHTLHHLYPSICHTHYRNLMPIYRKTLYEFNIVYKETTFKKLIINHFCYLEKLGKHHV